MHLNCESHDKFVTTSIALFEKSFSNSFCRSIVFFFLFIMTFWLYQWHKTLSISFIILGHYFFFHFYFGITMIAFENGRNIDSTFRYDIKILRINWFSCGRIEMIVLILKTQRYTTSVYEKIHNFRDIPKLI